MIVPRSPTFYVSKEEEDSIGIKSQSLVGVEWTWRDFGKGVDFIFVCDSSKVTNVTLYVSKEEEDSIGIKS